MGPCPGARRVFRPGARPSQRSLIPALGRRYLSHSVRLASGSHQQARPLNPTLIVPGNNCHPAPGPTRGPLQRGWSSAHPRQHRPCGELLRLYLGIEWRAARLALRSPPEANRGRADLARASACCAAPNAYPTTSAKQTVSTSSRHPSIAVYSRCQCSQGLSSRMRHRAVALMVKA